MAGVNKKAWAVLDDKEKMAIELMTIYGKSSWEAGEIMGIAHFKLLEIHKRAVRFFELFTYHFETYGSLFPKELSFLRNDFKEYMCGVILERGRVKDVTDRMYNWREWSITESRARVMDDQLKKLQLSQLNVARDLYQLILDFDAWNNFRVLPESWQEPSAYKRRNKVRDNKHLKNLISVPSVSLDFIWDKYNYTGKYQKAYVPLFSRDYPNGYKLMPIQFSAKKIKAMNNYCLYVFDNEILARRFSTTVADYYLQERKEVKSGQIFWQKFRELKELAVNFTQLEHVNISRRRVLKRLKT